MEAGRELFAGHGSICMESTSSTGWEAVEVTGSMESSPASCSGTSASGVGVTAWSAVSFDTPVSSSRYVGRGSKRWAGGSRYWFRTGVLLLLCSSVATCTLAEMATSLSSSDSSLAPAAPPANQVSPSMQTVNSHIRTPFKHLHCARCTPGGWHVCAAGCI